MQFFRQILISSTLAAAFLSPFTACAQESIGSSLDCTDVSVHYSDNAELTREERLAQMDKALFSSLNKFELCQSARNSNGSSSGTSGSAGEAGNSGQGSEGGDAGETGAFEGKSVATSGISGTEASESSGESSPDILRESGDMTETDVATTSTSQNKTSQTVNTKYEALNRGSGKLPEDIPKAANDDALAAQIRYAAENESDPVKKAQLWNEYRKYKGLPEK